MTAHVPTSSETFTRWPGDNTINTLARWFLQGLAALLPIGLTLAILYWLGTTAEATLGPMLRWVLPPGWYLPGMGILAGLVFVTAIGLLINAYLFSKLLETLNGLIRKIPLVSTLFDSIRDIAQFADPNGLQSKVQQPVLVHISEEITVMGFVMNESVQFGENGSAIPVYVPMSYQLGGFTLLVRDDQLEKLDMDVQSAMRFVLSAGLSSAVSPSQE